MVGRRDKTPILPADDREQARTRARRRAERQVDEREHLRLEIETRWHLMEVTALLRTDFEAQATTAHPETGQPKLNGSRMKLLLDEAKLKLAGHMQMLDKVLPSLKPVAMEGDLMDTSDSDAPPQVQIVSYENARLLRTLNARGGAPLPQDDKPSGEEPPWLM